MVIDIFVSEDMDLPIKREIGFVSTTLASERSEAIAMLKEEANKLGGNALILLRAGRVLSDPHFPSNEFYAHAVVVEI